jgi:hypothetical protein
MYETKAVDLMKKTAVRGFYQSTVRGKVILSADLITKENAAKYYVPDSIY